MKRRSVVLGGLIATGLRPGAASARTTVAATPAKDWRDPAWRDAYPRLSLAERDRRWAALRLMMARHDVAALIVSPLFGHDQLSHYISGDAAPVVVLPAMGDPAAFTFDPDTARAPIVRAQAQRQWGAGWIPDWRFGKTHADVADYLRERGLASARIGTVGYQTSLPLGPYMERGGRAWNAPKFWRDLGLALPQATWADLFWPFVETTIVKSQEEMAQFCKAAHLAELACRTFIDTMKPGVSQLEGQMAAAAVVQDHGGLTPTASGFRDSRRPVKAGETVSDEVIVYIGDTEAQAGYTVCLGKPQPDLRALFDAAERSLAIGLESCRPGVTLRELETAMERPFAEAGYWHLAPLYHGLNPMVLQGTTGAGLGRDKPGLSQRFFGGGETAVTPQNNGDFVLREGMLLHLEPNGSRGAMNVFLGVNVLLTAEGPELFSESSRRVHIKG